MIETKDIKNMVAHILRRDKGIADPQIMRPTREWFIGLAITLLVVLIGSWFCFDLYSRQTVKMNEQIVIAEAVVPYQAAFVSQAIDLFTIKQNNFTEIINTNSNVQLPVVDSEESVIDEVELNESETQLDSETSPIGDTSVSTQLAP